MRLIVYEVDSGRTIANVPTKAEYSRYSDKKLGVIEMEDVPSNWMNHKVIDGELALMDRKELNEIKKYGRILTKEERLLNKLKPSSNETTKAKNTIEMINLIQEVM